jgi:hypothetical protein
MHFVAQKEELATLLGHYRQTKVRNIDKVLTGPALPILKAGKASSEDDKNDKFLPVRMGITLVGLVALGVSLAISPLSAAIYRFAGHTSTNRIEPIKKLIDLINDINKDENQGTSLPDLCKLYSERYMSAKNLILEKESRSKEYLQLCGVIDSLDKYFECSNRFDQPKKLMDDEKDTSIRLTEIIENSSIYKSSSTSSLSSSSSSSVSSTPESSTSSVNNSI